MCNGVDIEDEGEKPVKVEGIRWDEKEKQRKLLLKGRNRMGNGGRMGMD
jgi:hypothetical protein